MTAAGHGKVHGGNHLEYNTFGYIIVSADERYLSIPFRISNDSILHLAPKANDTIVSGWNICVSGPSLNNEVPGTKVPERHLLELDLFTFLHCKCLDESEANVTVLAFCYPGSGEN